MESQLPYELWMHVALEFPWATLWIFERVSKLARILIRDERFLRAYYRRHAPSAFTITDATPPAPWRLLVVRIPLLRRWQHVPPTVREVWPKLVASLASRGKEHSLHIGLLRGGKLEWWIFEPHTWSYPGDSFKLVHLWGSGWGMQRPIRTLFPTFLDLFLVGTREGGVPIGNPITHVRLYEDELREL